MQYTPNFNLLQYAEDDVFLKEDINSTFAKIDEAIGDLQETINSSDPLVITQEIVDARKGELSLEDKITLLENADTDLSTNKADKTTIGNLSDLTTTNKTSIVGATNEVVSSLADNTSKLSKKTDGYISVMEYGAKDIRISGNESFDSTQAFTDAVNIANGKPIYVPDGEYRVNLNFTDEHIHFFGEGKLVHQQAKNVMTVKRTLGSPITISSISTVQIGANNPAIGVPTETNTKISISGSLVGINQGDLFNISSQDLYDFCTQMTAVKGYSIQVWKAGFVPVHGIGLDYTGAVNGGFTENDTVAGATSGATALVLSKTDTTLIFGKVSGDFVNGENLSVGGTVRGVASGTGYIIMSGKLIDTYTTSPVLKKVPTDKKFIIEGLAIKADGDVDSIVGSANRKPAIQLMGVANPIVKNFTIKSAWTRTLQLRSCWHGDLDVYIQKLPDNANESEGAYGYGVELSGATEGCRVKVMGGNCRHGFTTNVNWGGFQYMDTLDNGTIKYNTVHNSFIENALSASFDTHEGAYFTTFDNCRSVNSASGLRNVTASGGFQNRGFGTVYRNCRDRGSVVGFIEAGSQYEAGFLHYISYENCTSENYQQYGFQHVNSSVSDNAHIQFINCSTRGDGSAVNTPYYQVGFYLKAGIIELRDCRSYRFNGAPIQIAVGGGRYNVIDCFIDYFDCPQYATGLRFDGAPTDFQLYNYRVKVNTAISNCPQGLIRVASGSVYLNTDGISCINTSNPPPIAQVTGGSLSITQRSSTSTARPITEVGDADVTLTPRKSNPVQTFSSPLTADRTVTLDTTSGYGINGDTFTIVRKATATGAYNLNVGSNKVLSTAGQWCDVEWNGSAWVLVRAGSL